MRESNYFFGSFGERPDTAVYETIKYSYFDLRTRRCQDYYELSDTAKPYCNYYVADTMTVGHFFCNDYKLAKRGIWSDPVLISDTTIEGKNYKRARSFFLLDTTNGDYADYYIDCSLNTGIFYLLNSVDDLCKGCTAVRADNISKPIIHTTRFWFDRTKLSKKEKLIFKQWEINAKNVNLPLLKYMDGITTCPHLTDGKDSSRLKKYMPELFKKIDFFDNSNYAEWFYCMQFLAKKFTKLLVYTIFQIKKAIRGAF